MMRPKRLPHRSAFSLAFVLRVIAVLGIIGLSVFTGWHHHATDEEAQSCTWHSVAGVVFLLLVMGSALTGRSPGLWSGFPQRQAPTRSLQIIISLLALPPPELLIQS